MAKSIKQHKPICIDSRSEFFVALCKRGVHSYVTLGVTLGDKTEVLAAVGKVAHYDAWMCSFLLWDTEAFVKNERFMFGGVRGVLYKAYAINYQHYLEFLRYLQQLSLAQLRTKKVSFSLMAYCPSPERPTWLEWKAVDHFEKQEQIVCPPNMDRHGRIGFLANNCRHSAIRLTQQASERIDLGRGVSSFFFNKPPLQAVFSDGKVKSATPFYILPLPPNAFGQMSPQILRVITQLYQRLDELVLIEQNNLLTIQKFQQLKSLYTDLTRDCKTSIMDMMRGIEAWEKANDSLISAHRKPHWISFQTATQKMFANFHQEFTELRADPEMCFQ